MPLFEVAILEMPTRKQIEEEGSVEKLVFGPKPVVATDSQSAAIKATMDNPADLEGVETSRMNVLVRPFA
jgi:hypothetical protein